MSSTEQQGREITREVLAQAVQFRHTTPGALAPVGQSPSASGDWQLATEFLQGLQQTRGLQLKLRYNSVHHANYRWAIHTRDGETHCVVTAPSPAEAIERLLTHRVYVNAQQTTTLPASPAGRDAADMQLDELRQYLSTESLMRHAMTSTPLSTPNPFMTATDWVAEQQPTNQADPEYVAALYIMHRIASESFEPTVLVHNPATAQHPASWRICGMHNDGTVITWYSGITLLEVITLYCDRHRLVTTPRDIPQYMARLVDCCERAGRTFVLERQSNPAAWAVNQQQPDGSYIQCGRHTDLDMLLVLLESMVASVTAVPAETVTPTQSPYEITGSFLREGSEPIVMSYDNLIRYWHRIIERLPDCQLLLTTSSYPDFPRNQFQFYSNSANTVPAHVNTDLTALLRNMWNCYAPTNEAAAAADETQDRPAVVRIEPAVSDPATMTYPLNATFQRTQGSPIRLTAEQLRVFRHLVHRWPRCQLARMPDGRFRFYTNANNTVPSHSSPDLTVLLNAVRQDLAQYLPPEGNHEESSQ